MVIVMKPGTPEQEWKKIKENLEGRGYQIKKILKAEAIRLMKSLAAARLF